MCAKPLLILLTAALAGAAQAAAEPERERIASVVVSFSDLEPARPSDAEVLLERIHEAAWRACGGDARRHSSYEVMPRFVREVFAECRADAVSRAVAEVASPALSAAHAKGLTVD